MNNTRRIFTIFSTILVASTIFVAPAAQAQITTGDPSTYRSSGSAYNPYYVGNTNTGYYGSNTVFSFTGSPVTTAYVGVPYVYQPRISSYTGAVPSISLEKGPEGMFMDGSDTLQWVPAPNQLGQSFQISLLARDRFTNARTYNNFVVTVTSAPAPNNGSTGSTSGSYGTTISNGKVIPAFIPGGATGSTGATKTPDTFRSSPLASIFGVSSDSDALEIGNVIAQSGPVNLYDELPNTNCSVTVAWETNVASAGQVVYGTKSQPADSFAYEFTATESVSSAKNHEVALNCLENQTYYFRVIAFSDSQRVVSEEMVIFPFKVDGVLTGGSVLGASAGSASVFATIGSIFINPFTLLILLVLAIATIFFVFANRKPKHSITEANKQQFVEPQLMIPDAPEATA